MNENTQLIIKVTAGNLRNSHVYITGHHDFFPSDCVGGPNRRAANNSSSPIKIKLDGLNTVVETDIARDSTTGKPRKELRNRSAFGSFFIHHQIQPGDQLLLRRISTREYVLTPYKTVFQDPRVDLKTRQRTTLSATNSLELFVGAGGLALGTHNAGFRHAAVLDWDPNACNTLRRNKSTGATPAADWDIVEGDVRSFDFAGYRGRVKFVFGGPPCQPFSLGGKHLGHEDERNMFPEAVRAVREIQPIAFVFENVKGLLRKGFENYYNYIIHQLEFPESRPRGDQDWISHLAELERLHTSGSRRGLRYNVVYQMLNAADFGVPQRRERVFIVGIRADLGLEYSHPTPTHTEDALLYDKWVTGSYWDRHHVPERQRPAAPSELRARIRRLQSLVPEMLGLPWRTVRDAIHGLPVLREGKRSKKITNHYLNPGARSYAGHSGSPLDEPAKTLKAGDHGVPGGENTLRLEDGSVRYFSVRECARIQTFPDEWDFDGAWTECMRQLGNAVPVKLGEAVARRLAEVVAGSGDD